MDLGRGTVSSLLRNLETGLIPNVVPNLHGHTSFARHMALHSVLDGHHGCVNRLAFSEDASLLLSGADDCHLHIWAIESGTSVTKRARITPGHFANIFGVAFMPSTGNQMVASGGLDHLVRHTHVETANSTLWTHHTDMVKTVQPFDTHTIITASKDGTARLIDVRQSPTVEPPIFAVIQARYGQLTPISSAIPSPINSHHVLVAASDQFMRIFDLRVPSTRRRPSVPAIDDRHCVESYCPPHLHPSAPEPSILRGFFSIQSTYANFSSDGSQIVASYFDDSVFVFDRPHQSRPTLCKPPFASKAKKNAALLYYNDCAARDILGKRFDQALTAARRVLEIDENDLFAQLCIAFTVSKCNLLSDRRTSCAYINLALRQLQNDHLSIVRLWGWSEPSDLPPDFKKLPIWAEMTSIWKVILEYFQIDNLLHLCPPLYERPFGIDSHERDMITRRLNNLDRLCAKLISHCEKEIVSPEKSKEFEQLVYSRAILQKDALQAMMKFGDIRARALTISTFVDRFTRGIIELCHRIKHLGSLLRIPSDSHDNAEAVETTEGADTLSSDSSSEEEEDEEHDDYEVPDFPIALIYRYGHNRHYSSSGSSDRLEEDCNDLSQLWGPLNVQKGCYRFHGHESRETEIKEANFFGSKNQVVLSGSDDGNVYMWSSSTGALLSRVHADEQIVNCVLGHPHHTTIFASGIDNTIKVLTPGKSVVQCPHHSHSDSDSE